jgi:cytochrome P450
MVSTLRAELRKVSKDTLEDYWTKDSVSELHLLDSTIRESMRLSDFGSLAFPRRVAAQNGIDISGIHVPKGAWMQIPMHNIHTDEDNYADASQFRPFRFAGPHAPKVNIVGENESDNQPQKSLVTLDDSFLTFGYGRFGCPGRTFGAHLMKVMLAYILEHHDIEPLDARPHVSTLMEYRFTSPSTKIRICRKGRSLYRPCFWAVLDSTES